jgi:site-specific DNA recombinase
MIYSWIADEGRSTLWVAEELTRRGVPPEYTQEGRSVRRKRTSGIWRPARIGKLVRNTTYKGVHIYGKFSKRFQPVERSVPAIATPETWDMAQATFRRNLAFVPRNTRREYLLRGPIKCGDCGLTYTGAAYTTSAGVERRYYTCNGRAQARGIYGENGMRCPNPALPYPIKDQIWNDIDAWLENPGQPLEEIAKRQRDEESAGTKFLAEIDRLRRALAAKEGERERLVSAFRKGIIEEADLEADLTNIRREVDSLHIELQSLEQHSAKAEKQRAQLSTAADLLDELRVKRNNGLSYPVKRQIVETLAEGITVEMNGAVVVRYRFTPITDYTDVRVMKISFTVRQAIPSSKRPALSITASNQAEFSPKR